MTRDEFEKQILTIKWESPEGTKVHDAENALLAEYDRLTAPVRWRDGAVEVPDKTVEESVWVYSEFWDNILKISNWKHFMPGWWSGKLWLYEHEFPMPLPPLPVEPEIEPCPFCGTGGEDIVCEEKGVMWDEDIVCEKIGGMWRVICTCCGYHSISSFDKSKTIKAHNKFAWKVRA